MNLVYCFIGNLPQYAIDTVHQARLFFDGPIYFIISDINSKYAIILKDIYNVIIITYDECKSDKFNNIVSNNYSRFCIVDKLVGREKLFIYSFERFILLYALMVNYNLNDVFFAELDNLIYDDPRKWQQSLSKKDAAYMFDNFDRCSSGICYIKNYEFLDIINNYFIHYIQNSTKFISEMTALYEIFEAYPDRVQILPTIWSRDNIPKIMYEGYNNYNDTIFDASSIGIYLGGMDPKHTDGEIVKGLKNMWAYHDYTQYIYEWRKDELDRNIPYIYNTNDNKWIRINNLHIHSKLLADCLSKPI